MSSITEDIEKLRREAEEKTQEAANLSKLLELYPDLKKKVGRWNRIAYYSQSVNSQVDTYYTRHNCGCCSDSPLEVWPYLTTPFGPVYSDPPFFFIGERSDYGDRPNSNWELDLRSSGIPESLIDKMKSLFPEEAFPKETYDDELPDPFI